MINSRFGETIKNARLAKGISLRELARRLDISHPYLSQLETGKNDTPSILILKKLARFLDIPFFYIALLSNTDIGLKNEVAKRAKETANLYHFVLSNTDFFKKLQSYDIFENWIRNELFEDGGSMYWNERILKELYDTFKLFEEIEKKFMATEEVSLIEAFTKGSSPSYSNVETNNRITGIGKTHDLPINDFYFHLTDNAIKTYKGIPLLIEDKDVIKEFIENYLIRKLTSSNELDKEAIKVLLDENFHFPHQKE